MRENIVNIGQKAQLAKCLKYLNHGKKLVFVTFFLHKQELNSS
jgi:hypothetical protein